MTPDDLPSYGLWTDEMSDSVRSHVAEKIVWDLGAGFLAHSVRMLELGARGVVAVDRHPCPLSDVPSGVAYIQSTFSRLPLQDIEVALLAWPVNRALLGLPEILRRSRVVIYLGCNVDGTACGWPDLMRYLCTREVLAHVEHRRNTLAVYGDVLPDARPLLGEELAGISDEVLTFDEARRRAGPSA